MSFSLCKEGASRPSKIDSRPVADKVSAIKSKFYLCSDTKEHYSKLLAESKYFVENEQRSV